MGLAIDIAPELHDRVRLGVVVLDGVFVRKQDEMLQDEIERYGQQLRGQNEGARSAEVAGAADARTLYKDLGMDPTKTRPSSEALLRRVLKGETLYRINTLVDALNLCSLRAQLPFGLYDLGQVEPPVVLRRGAPGESYEGIRKAAVNVDGRPVLADARGAFGNPSSDSERTMVRPETTRALVTVYAPARYALPRLERVLDDTAATLTRYCGGTLEERRLLP